MTPTRQIYHGKPIYRTVHRWRSKNSKSVGDSSRGVPSPTPVSLIRSHSRRRPPRPPWKSIEARSESSIALQAFVRTFWIKAFHSAKDPPGKRRSWGNVGRPKIHPAHEGSDSPNDLAYNPRTRSRSVASRSSSDSSGANSWPMAAKRSAAAPCRGPRPSVPVWPQPQPCFSIGPSHVFARSSRTTARARFVAESRMLHHRKVLRQCLGPSVCRSQFYRTPRSPTPVSTRDDSKSSAAFATCRMCSINSKSSNVASN